MTPLPFSVTLSSEVAAARKGAARGWLAMSAILASLGAMAALDAVTGQELVFSCAYLVPVSLSAWWFSRRVVLGMAVASGATAWLVDHFDGYEYSNPTLEYWNAFTCLLISLITGLVLCRLRQTLEQKQAANEELRRALEQLEASTLEIRKLQSGLQTVCAWTKRIKVGEQ